MSDVQSVSSVPHYTIHVTGSMPLEPRFFFDDSDTNAHEGVTAEECAREIANYVDKHGLSRFLLDWNLDDVNVYVNDVEAVVKGIAKAL